jgi:hypothetical protein
VRTEHVRDRSQPATAAKLERESLSWRRALLDGQFHVQELARHGDGRTPHLAPADNVRPEESRRTGLSHSQECLGRGPDRARSAADDKYDESTVCLRPRLRSADTDVICCACH